MYAYDDESYSKKFQAFGWEAIKVDGHSCSALVHALKIARNEESKPTIILAKTFKGKGMTAQIEGKEGWHGKALGGDGEKVINQLLSEVKNPAIQLKPEAPEGVEPQFK
jgi:transketolase